MSGPLSGIRVVDATSYVFGPVATQMLGDMGADVIKIEPPEGDPTRRIGKSRSSLMGSFFLNLNRNKRSVVLDLKLNDDRDALLSLLGSADVFVHNMRSSAIRKLGLSYDVLAPRLPTLVYATAQGFGSGGRYFDRPAYDDVIQGFSGIAGLNERMSGTASFAPMLLTDKLCGVFLAFAIAAAVVHRQRTGRGQEVQVPMFESMVSFNLLEHLADAVLAPMGHEESTSAGYARVFGKYHRPLRTKDSYICVIANTDAQWQRLMTLIGKSDMLSDPDFADIGRRMANISRLYEAVEEGLRSHTTSEWMTIFEQADIPASPSYSLDDLMTDPHLADVEFFTKFDHESEGKLLLPRIPLSFSDSPGAIRGGPPRLGEHTEEVLRECGRNTTADCRL